MPAQIPLLNPEPPHETNRTRDIGQNIETQTENAEAPSQEAGDDRPGAGGGAPEDRDVGEGEGLGQQLMPRRIRLAPITCRAHLDSLSRVGVRHSGEHCPCAHLVAGCGSSGALPQIAIGSFRSIVLT